MAVAFRDYYEVLGVPRDASASDIRKAYRALARKHHPDVSKDPAAKERFSEISEAYEVLRDKDKRARYDRLGANWKAGDDVSSRNPGRAGAQGFDEGFRVEYGEGDGGFSDFFSQFFGERGGGRRTAGFDGFDGFSLRGSDQEAAFELTLQEAAAGGSRRIVLGNGRELDVSIPAGVRDGQRIRLAGQGEPGAGGGPSGDLYLRIRVLPDRRFRVEGRDLYVDLPITPWEAALGATVEVQTLTRTAKLRVPGGSSSGRRLRLRGQGLPNPSGAPGNLYAVLKIVVPKTLSDEERAAFERLAEVSQFDPRSGSS
jgi:curved DNA-binding protein